MEITKVKYSCMDFMSFRNMSATLVNSGKASEHALSISKTRTGYCTFFSKKKSLLNPFNSSAGKKKKKGYIFHFFHFFLRS